MTHPADAYLDAMHDQANRRLSHTIVTVTRAVFNADGFAWNRPAIRATIAARFRDLPDDTDAADGIAQVICAVYTDHEYPHDPAAVRQAVARQLDGAGPHGDQPGAQTSW